MNIKFFFVSPLNANNHFCEVEFEYNPESSREFRSGLIDETQYLANEVEDYFREYYHQALKEIGGDHEPVMKYEVTGGVGEDSEVLEALWVFVKENASSYYYNIK